MNFILKHLDQMSEQEYSDIRQATVAWHTVQTTSGQASYQPPLSSLVWFLLTGNLDNKFGPLTRGGLTRQMSLVSVCDDLIADG